ncbi:MAG: GGDEF domain-containing protein [Gemmatimonadetes bacterium]|nr:GGDEF domain-containing protein [Gemmatimonadota bacterium]
MTRAAGALAGASGALLLLAALTGALHSPLLLLVPLPLLLLAIRLTTGRAAAAAVLLAVLLLVAAEGVVGSVTGWELGAALVAAGMFVLVVTLARRWLKEGVAADRLGLRLAAPDIGGESAEAAELAGQLALLRAWSGADAVVLWEAAAGRARPVAAAGRGLPPALPLEGDPLGWVAREGTTLRLEQTPRWASPGARLVAARVSDGADVAWLLTWEYPAAQEPPGLDALAAYAAPLRAVLAALARERDTLAGQQRLEALLVLLRRIPAEIELAAFGRELLQAALALTGGTGGCVGTWNGEQGQVFAHTGSDGGPAAGASFAPPHSELALAVRAAAPILRESGRWRPGDTQVANQDDEWRACPRVLASFPLLTPSGAVGAMALWSTRATGFDGRALDLLGAVLPYAALHLDHALEYGRLRERADRDVLTGLRNRRAFDAALLAERLRFERYARPLAALLLDIDHFKSINDTYGHEAGDDVLRTIARVLESAIRDVDIPARYGGEEFVVLLPETAAPAAAEVAERVRAAVERSTFGAAGRPLQVRGSIGVAACPELVATPQALLGSADAALYEAKRGGRNQVCLAQPAPRL